MRSAGTSRNARRTVSADDLQWADIVFVMEEKHKSRLVASFRSLLQSKRLVVLDIPDEYQYMDPELIALLHDPVAHALELGDVRGN